MSITPNLLHPMWNKPSLWDRHFDGNPGAPTVLGASYPCRSGLVKYFFEGGRTQMGENRGIESWGLSH